MPNNQKLIDDFTQEVIESDPEFVADAQSRYLEATTEKFPHVFTQEQIKENPKLVTDSMIAYLDNEIDKVYHKIANLLLNFTLSISTPEKWWNETVVEDLTPPLWAEAKRLEYERDIYLDPKPIDYSKKIIDSDIERASSVNCRELIKTNSQGFARCIFHADKHPSMKVYAGDRGYYCFSCQASGNAIHLVRKLHNLDFPEAVRYLTNRV